MFVDKNLHNHGWQQRNVGLAHDFVVSLREHVQTHTQNTPATHLTQPHTPHTHTHGLTTHRAQTQRQPKTNNQTNKRKPPRRTQRTPRHTQTTRRVKRTHPCKHNSYKRKEPQRTRTQFSCTCWAEAPIKIARMTLTIKLDRNWNSFQLANNAPPLSVTDGAIAPSARMHLKLSSRATLNCTHSSVVFRELLLTPEEQDRRQAPSCDGTL